jgi:hypothetical protein
MSATLGLGGDLERLTGRKSIARLPAPEGFQSSGVGRRFFLFPTLSMDLEESLGVVDALHQMAGRSVVLTPSTLDAESHVERIEDSLDDDFIIFTKETIEHSKHEFVTSEKAVTVLANRYDGIDFPGDECRLLCVDGLPKAVNLQEKFIMTKMGAGALYSDRIQTRILQAMGRCTRSLQDRSAVVVLGEELVDFLVDKRKWKYLPPELQAELTFAVTESTEVTANNLLENFGMFLENDTNWSSVDFEIRSAVSKFSQEKFPEMSQLESIVSLEIEYQDAIWNKDYITAFTKCRQVLTEINHPNLRGYRALWHYLAGAASHRLSKSQDDANYHAALEHYRSAKSAAPIISWLNNLVAPSQQTVTAADVYNDPEIESQVELIEQNFVAMGVSTNNKFEKKASKILTDMEKPQFFESSQVDLGHLLGFYANNEESDAAPDPWWLGNKIGIVFEAHADGHETTVLGATKTRQALTHSLWLGQYEEKAKSKTITPILLTPTRTVGRGAYPTLDGVLYWNLSDYKGWVASAISVLRNLKSTLPGEGDLVWREEAASTLVREGLSLNQIIQNLPLAQTAMVREGE